MLNDLSTLQPLIERTGWTLLHFLWQGTLVALLLAGALRLLRGSAARLRHAFCLAALALLAVLPPATWMLMPAAPVVTAPASDMSTTSISALLAAAPAATAEAHEAASWQTRLYATLHALLPWLVGCWALGVLGLSGRLFGGWLYTYRLRFRQAEPAPSRWQKRLAALTEQMLLLQPVRLLQSRRVDSPLVVGWLRPMILVPTGVFTGLPPEQIEAILAHELAHIRRHDYLTNLLQSVVETLLFYHPAVWWISRQLRIEREYCCDDAAVDACRSRLTYARALTALETRRGPSALAPAATDGDLLMRIRRLVKGTTAASSSPSHLAAGSAALLLTAVLVAAACAPSSASVTGAPATRTTQPVALADTTKQDAQREGRRVIIGGSLSSSSPAKGTAPRVFIHRGDSLWNGKLPFDADSLKEHIRQQVRLVEYRIDSLRAAGVFDIGNVVADSLVGLGGGPVVLTDLADSMLASLPDLDNLIFHPSTPPLPNIDSLLHRHQHKADSLALLHERRMEKRQEFLRQRQEEVEQDQERLMEHQAEHLEEQARRMQEQAERLRERAERMREQAEQQP